MSLRIDSRGTPDQQARYRREVEAVRAQIRRTRTGRILLKHIDHEATHEVVIVPYTDADRNAEAVPGSWAAAGTASATRVARGTTSRVRFSVGRSVMPPNWPQGTADEVLVHELAHALRQITGTQRYRGGQLLRIASFGNVEEFFAAMVASVYSSELGRPPLGNHGQWRLRNPDVLQRKPYSTRLRETRTRMPLFCEEMSRIPPQVAAFNPFRDVRP